MRAAGRSRGKVREPGRAGEHPTARARRPGAVRRCCRGRRHDRPCHDGPSFRGQRRQAGKDAHKAPDVLVRRPRLRERARGGCSCLEPRRRPLGHAFGHARGVCVWGSFVARVLCASRVLSFRFAGGFLPDAGPARCPSPSDRLRLPVRPSLLASFSLGCHMMRRKPLLRLNGEHGGLVRALSACGGVSGWHESSHGALGGEKSEAGGGVVQVLLLGVGGQLQKPIFCIFIQHHKIWTDIVCPTVPWEGRRPL